MLLLLTMLFLLRLICITHCLFSSFCNSSTHLYKKLPIYTAPYKHKTSVSYFFGIQRDRTVDMGTCHSTAETICKAGNKTPGRKGFNETVHCQCQPQNLLHIIPRKTHFRCSLYAAFLCHYYYTSLNNTNKNINTIINKIMINVITRTVF